MNKKTLSRRQILQGAAVGTTALSGINPLEAIIRGTLDSILMKAHAQETCGDAPRNYICIDLYGGLPLWHFMPIKPLAGMPMDATNARLSNAFDSSGNPFYKDVALTKNGQTHYLPPLWATQIPTALNADGSSLGSTAAMDLYEHMFLCRGVYMQLDGHVENSIKQVRPNLAEPSLMGAIADRSCGKLLAAASGPSNVPGTAPVDVYSSKNGTGISRALSYPNALMDVMAPFDRAAVGASIDRRMALNAVDQALSAIDSYFIGRNPASRALKTERQNAETLLAAGISNLLPQWNTLVTKYKRLIHASKGVVDVNGSYKIPGVSDNPVAPVNDFSCDVEYLIAGTNPARLTNPDLRSIVDTVSELDDMAEGFALCEFLITNGYSSTVSFQPYHRISKRFHYIYTDPVLGPRDHYFGSCFMDEHSSGSRTSIIIMAWYFHALMACLFELIQKLKSTNTFSETVLQVLSEFGRSPRNDQGGADHGWEGGFLWFFCGDLPQPATVVGNLKVTSTDALRSGTWQAAPATVAGVDRYVVPGNSVSTIASWLRIESPTPNDVALILPSGGMTIPETPENKP